MSSKPNLKLATHDQPTLIKSVAETDQEVLMAISSLYLNSQPFACDPTYSSGVMWRGVNSPTLKYDVNPINPSVEHASSLRLPLNDKSIESIAFDPPFMFGTHGQTKNNAMNKRFTMFDSWQELVDMYRGSLREFNRVLKPSGILAFKCQDYTDSRTTLTHCHIYQWALECGFREEDLFILVRNGGRIYNPMLVQRHSRKFHFYWMVFRKTRNQNGGAVDE